MTRRFALFFHVSFFSITRRSDRHVFTTSLILPANIYIYFRYNERVSGRE